MRVPYHDYHPVELSTGGKHTILIKRSDKLKEGQIRGLLRDINKKTLALADLKEKLTSPKAKKRKRDRLERQITRLLSGQFIKEVIRVTIHENQGRKSGFEIDYQIDEKGKERIIENIFGKKFLFTNRGEWTGQKIKVHTFICLLGLLLAKGLRKRIFDAEMKMSREEILSHLGNRRESTTIFSTGTRGRPRVTIQLEEMDETEKKLFDMVEKISV